MSSMLAFSLLSLLAFVSITVAFTEQGIKDWDENDVEKWLKATKMSDDGVKYILKSGISDGEDLIWIRDEQKTKSELISGFKKISDKVKFEQGLNDLIESEQQQPDPLKEQPNDEIENIMKALKERCLESNTRNDDICKCINKKSADDIEDDTESETIKESETDGESETESDTLKRHYQDRQNKNDNVAPRIVEIEEKREKVDKDVNKKLDVDYTVNEMIEGDELRTEISFNILNDDIDGIVFLSWCAVDNSDDFCSKQSFSFRQRKKNEIKATILTGIAYDFEIYDEMNKYHWTLSDFSDSKPNQAFYFSGIIIHSILNKDRLNDDKLRNSNGANFDMLIEVQLSHKFGIGINQQRIDCDSNDNNDDPSEIELICVLNIVPNSVDENDKLMAEKIRSVLLDKYRANNVDISQKMDSNSFQGTYLNDGWSLSSNSVLFILCAAVLCGGIIVGIYKKFPFKYKNVYSKLLDNKDNKSDEMNEHNFESISIQNEQQKEKELNVKAPKNSAEEFLEKVFHSQGTPSFITSKYIQNLKDDYITSIDQLREFDDGDWKRYGFKNNHIIVIKNKLHQDDDDEDDDGSTFDDDDDDDNNLKNIKQTDNNESTTDFDDF